jgi:beta-glucosidase
MSGVTRRQFVQTAGAFALGSVGTVSVAARGDETATPSSSGRPVDPKIEQRVDALLRQLTPQEKILLLGGDATGFATFPIPRLKIPKLVMADGPQGVRNFGQACAFPCGSALAATWDIDLARRYGQALGLEGRARGVNFQLGPGINICRSPLNGRNFEYFGEDPFLTGHLAAAWIAGLQGEGVSATVKHFACNNQESRRGEVNVWVDDRALHEIYLPGFRRAVGEGGSWALMNAYNRLQGEYCSTNRKLLQKTLKEAWGFQGLVMSDWGSCHNTDSLAHGLDLEMPHGKFFSFDNLQASLTGNVVSDADIDEAARRLLRVAAVLGFLDREQKRPELPLDSKDSGATALAVARSAVVLLKNEQALLPLKREAIRHVAIYGPNAAKTPVNGGGSGSTTPFHSVDFATGIRQLAGKDIAITVVPMPSVNPQQAVTGAGLPDLGPARGADVVIVCAGLDRSVEHEGADRKEFGPPLAQQQLISALAAANPQTVVVLNSGGALGMDPWHEAVPAILQAWYLGQEGGTAVGEILFGEVNPSGRLPVTYGAKIEDYSSTANFPGSLEGPAPLVHYEESIYVGYRDFDHTGKAPLFPFGHGLSYTTFAYDAMALAKIGDAYNVSLNIKNTGARAGAEVVQIYVGQPQCSIDRPVRELKGFAKIFLKPGEMRRLEITLEREAFMFWSPTAKDWTLEPGNFVVEAGASSRDIRLKVTFAVA